MSVDKMEIFNQYLIKHPKEANYIKILTTNFRLGPKKIDIIALNEYNEILLIQLSKTNVQEKRRDKISKNMKNYILSIEDFFSISQRDLSIKAILITPNDYYVLDNLRIALKRTSKQNPEIITNEINELLNNKLSNKEFIDLVILRYDEIFKKIFPYEYNKYDVKPGEQVNIRGKYYYPNLILKKYNKIEKIVIIESYLPMDPMLRDKRIFNLKNNIEEYKKIVKSTDILVITQRIESEIKTNCEKLQISYLALSNLFP